MKPLIGVTPSKELGKTYYAAGEDSINAVSRAGGLPLVLPFVTQDEEIDQLAGMLDGLLLTGGDDIDPTLFGEEPHKKLGNVTPDRDAFEIAITKKMLEMNKPILGVCRGAQILNVAAGGNLYQDIYAQIDHELLQHAQRAPIGHGSHFAHVSQGSLLHRLTGLEKLKVNSRHHQANRRMMAPFYASAKASDGIVEAIESKEHSFALGVQWHPENMATVHDEPSLKIFRGFVEASAKRFSNIG